jgi:hypothetical protein
MSSGGRIVLGEDDFDDVPQQPTGTTAAPRGQPQPQPQQSPAAGLPPVARRAPVEIGGFRGASSVGGLQGTGTGKPGASGDWQRWLYDAKTGPLIAAVVGVALAWAITEVLDVQSLQNNATTKSGLNAAAGVWIGCIGVVFAAVVLGFDRAVAGAWPEAWRRAVRAAVPAFAVGFGSGYAAQAVYTHMVLNAFKDGDLNPASGRFYLARVIGWAIFGLGIGVTFGLIERAQRKAVNGALGGLAGGAIGGLIFQYVGLHVHSEGSSRLLGLLGVGLMIALAIRAVEAVRREAWLQIVAGGMAGKEFVLYHAITRVGATPDCEIFLLKDPAVQPLHAQIEDRGSQRILTAAPGATVYINQQEAPSKVLRHGDQIQIGNTVIGYAERAVAPAPTGVV